MCVCLSDECVCVSDLCAVLSGGLCGQTLDFLSVEHCGSTVVFGVGCAGGTALLTEEGTLWGTHSH